MFSHIMIGSNDIARAKSFYDAVIRSGGACRGPAMDQARGFHSRRHQHHDHGANLRPQEQAKSPEEQALHIQEMPDPARREKRREIMDRGLDAGPVMTALVRFARLFRDMERQLAKTEWLAGDAFALADIGLVSFFHRMDMLHAALWQQHFPRVERWLARMRERPSFTTAITDFIGPAKVAIYSQHAEPEAARVAAAFERASALI